VHELSITQSVVDTISERIDAERISGVRLEIGPLSGVLADAVRFCFDVVCAGTRLEGAWLEIVEPTAKALCRECGTEFEPDGPIVLCECGSADVTVLVGRELRITAVEVV
jgi:hydrogenase nickel incorporation protein HypA/HybF